MNDNLDKNIDLENLEDKELEQVSGGDKHKVRILEVMFCEACGKEFSRAMRGQRRPKPRSVCDNCGAVNKIVWKSEEEYIKRFDK